LITCPCSTVVNLPESLDLDDDSAKADEVGAVQALERNTLVMNPYRALGLVRHPAGGQFAGERFPVHTLQETVSEVAMHLHRGAPIIAYV
jgi:hypothetical protein